MATEFERKLDKYKNIKIVVYILIVSLAIIGLANVISASKSIYNEISNFLDPPKPKIPDNELISNTLTLSKNLMDFAHMRQVNDPRRNTGKMPTSEDSYKLWEQGVKYSDETKKIFLTEYYPKIRFLLGEYKKHNISPGESFQWRLETLSSSYEINDIALKLINMAQDFKSTLPKSIE